MRMPKFKGPQPVNLVVEPKREPGFVGPALQLVLRRDVNPRLPRFDAHTERPRLPVVLKRGREVWLLQRRFQFVRIDLPHVIADLPTRLPVVGDLQRDVTELPHGAKHFKAG